MRKYLPYILGALLITSLVILVITGNNKKRKTLDEHITLRRQDKIPYGTYVAFESLKSMFPNAKIIPSNDPPGYWSSISYNPGQAIIIISDKFIADDAEMRKLIGFAEQGNDVFISAMTMSLSAADIINCEIDKYSLPTSLENYGTVVEDSMSVTLDSTVFGQPSSFRYPGKSASAAFVKTNEQTSNVLGNVDGMPTFIHLRAGKGNFYVHLAPLAFSNYFLLHKDNIHYYEKILSLINPSVKNIIWDEYYINKRFVADNPRDNSNDESKSWFSVLMNIENSNGDKPFRWAFWLLIILLILYVLQEMRRKQRFIPPMPKPRNDSMDFVKTIGRLYHDTGDHRNLARKMASYFLEHVRNKYKLLTGTLDETFVKNLQHKSGVDEKEISRIVNFINFLRDTPAVSDRQLLNFHQWLETFYQVA